MTAIVPHPSIAIKPDDWNDLDIVIDATLLRPHVQQALRDAERIRHPVPALTARQRDLLHLLAAGHTNTQIARRMGISEGTVRNHLSAAIGKTQAGNRAEAVLAADSNGWL